MTEVVFETARLRAVPWRPKHAAAAFAAYSDPEFVRYFGQTRLHTSVDDTLAWIGRIREQYAARGVRAGFWALERRDDGEPVGATLCQPLPGGDGEHEIGWHVFPPYQGRGLATESGLGAARYGVEVLGLDEVFAIVAPANEPSLAVARRLGMHPAGRTTRYYDGFEGELFRLSRPEIEAAAPAAPRR